MNIIENRPDAYILIKALRSIGYDFQSAIADIIDNSISAKATKIEVKFPTHNVDSSVHFVDNGEGMTREELIEALRFGTDKPDRNEKDLGRFGLGLKTASFSQCLKFSVISKKNGFINGFCWDYDYIATKPGWPMIELNETEISDTIERHSLRELESFTIVIWEKFDRLDSSKNVINNTSDIFLEYMDEAYEHCSLVFHEFTSEGLHILFNGRRLKKVDPFLSNHNKTDTTAPEQINVKDKKGNNVKIDVQFFVLPFLKDLSPADRELTGGDALLDKQGFYVYRNKRLLIYGTWFRMQRPDALSKNARIKVNIPTQLDEMWGIDVKKQKAIIPKVVLEQLRAKMVGLTKKSKRIYQHKGELQVNDKSVWRTVTLRNKEINYAINLDNQSIKDFLEKLDDDQADYATKIFDLISSSLPYIDIHNNVASHFAINVIDEEKKNEFAKMAILQYRSIRLISSKNKEELIDEICSNEPFLSSDIKNILIKELVNDE